MFSVLTPVNQDLTFPLCASHSGNDLIWPLLLKLLGSAGSRPNL
jgi:hypothetical protein